MKKHSLPIFLLILWINACKPDSNITSTIMKYQSSAKASKVQQRVTKETLSSWAREYEIQRVDVSVRIRMLKVKPEDDTFKNDGSKKWMECAHLHRKDVNGCKRFYLENEQECLRKSTSRDTENILEVNQLDKEIVKWRRGYRYLIKLCNDENPDNKENAKQCLVDYMQKDQYDEEIERLMALERSALSRLNSYYITSIKEFRQCLSRQLSRYLDRLMTVRDTLYKCQERY